MKAYYNDHDKNVCRWIEQLIKNGDITKGDVDDRSITEVKPDDIAGYDRVHLFAGIGTWDYALNKAGWGDRQVLTASLPCQPFSSAGKQLGKDDERHLLPTAIGLIKQSGIATCFGEQVPGAIKHGWLDDLYAEMEACGYAVGSIIAGAHSVNAAHIRQRLYWVAHSVNNSSKREVKKCDGQKSLPEITNREGFFKSWESCRAGEHVCWLADTNKKGLQRREGAESANKQPSWSASMDDGIEWIYCRDNKYRPVKSGTIKMAHGLTRGMVCCCYSSQEDEKINATENKADTREVLQALPQENGEEENKFKTGGLFSIQKTKVLQQGLHGESLRRGDESKEFEKCAPTIGEDSRQILRGVWEDTHVTCSSCGRKRYEKRSIEFDDIVRSMPQGSALETFFCAGGEEFMQTLQKTGDEKRPLLDTQYSLSEVWRSLDDESKERVRVHFDQRAWLIDRPIRPLVKNMRGNLTGIDDPIHPNCTQEARSMRLNGYGNAIQADLATEFIKSFMAL